MCKKPTSQEVEKADKNVIFSWPFISVRFLLTTNLTHFL